MRLTEHFTLQEFLRYEMHKFNEGNPVPEELIASLTELSEELEFIRDIIQVPIIVSSGYRSPERNAKVGGAKKSYHMVGRAADIIPAFSKLANLQRATLSRAKNPESRIRGIGFYKTHVHVDIRATKNLVFWRT